MFGELFGSKGGLEKAVNESTNEVVTSSHMLAVISKDFTVPFKDLSSTLQLLATRHVTAFNEHSGVLRTLGFTSVAGQLARLNGEAANYANRVISEWNVTLGVSEEVKAVQAESDRRDKAAEAANEAFEAEMEALDNQAA